MYSFRYKNIEYMQNESNLSVKPQTEITSTKEENPTEHFLLYWTAVLNNLIHFYVEH